MINLFLYTMLVLATAVANAFIDNYLIKKKWGKVKSLNHTSRTVIRFCIFTLGVYFIWDLKETLPLSIWGFIKDLLKPFLIGLYSFFLFNIVFDYLLNKLRGLPWYYDGKDAITDRLSGVFNEDVNEFIACIELGIKLLLTIILALWILAI